MRWTPVVLACMSWLGPSATFDQIESGPKADSKPEPFPVFMVTGDLAGKTVEVLTGRQDLPTLVLVLPKEHWGRPVARFVKALDRELEKGVEGAGGAAAVAVWLSDDVANTKDYLPRAQQSLVLTKTALSVFEGSRFGPPSWSLNDAAHVTAVVTRGDRVVKSLAFESVDEDDVRDVIKTLRGGN
jgi:hypothetical protein